MRHERIVAFLTGLLARYKMKPNHLAKKIGVSHATVLRWLSGEDKPNVKHCYELAKFSGTSLCTILYMAEHIKTDITEEDSLPPFREYMERKYPEVLPEKVIVVLEEFVSPQE